MRSESARARGCCSPARRRCAGTRRAGRESRSGCMFAMTCPCRTCSVTVRPRTRPHPPTVPTVEQRRDRQRSGTTAPASTCQPAGERAGAEQRHRHGVRGGHQRAEPRVDDAGGHEQVKRVGRDAEQVEQERDRGVDVAEHHEQAGPGQLRVVAAGTIVSENQPANRTKLSDSSLPACGKLNDVGTITSGSDSSSGSSPARNRAAAPSSPRSASAGRRTGCRHERRISSASRVRRHHAGTESASARRRGQAGPRGSAAARRAM